MYQQQPPPQRVVTKRGANHTLHVILTICTCGIWAITGWPIAAAMGRKSTTTAYPPQQQWQQPPPPPGYGYPPQQQPPPPGPQWPPRQ